MLRAYREVIHCVFDQILNLQYCFTTPNKTKEGRGPEHLPPSPFSTLPGTRCPPFLSVLDARNPNFVPLFP